MERYVIEGQVEFDPDENRLIHLVSAENVMLPLIASRILFKLIVQQGHVVDRETIFTEIFDRYDAAGTNNNLNQYVLTLRKQFQYLGLENEIIQTVPRIGFILLSGVEIFKQQKPVLHAPLQGGAKVKDNNFQKPAHHLSYFSRIWLGAMIALMFGSGIYYWHEKNGEIKWEGYPVANAVLLNGDKTCQIFLIPNGQGYKQGDFDYHSELKHFEGVQCPENMSTRFYLFRSNFNGDKYRNFVMKCTGDRQKRPSCFSIYKSVERGDDV